MQRSTFRFQSDSGAEYLYDDITGNIFPWGSLSEAILKQELGIALDSAEIELLQSTPTEEITAKANRYMLWRNRYGAFARPERSLCAVPPPEQMVSHVWNGAFELILIVTENCNLKCSYCAYASGAYQYNRKPTDRTMSYEQATRAIDWFKESVSTRIARNPRKSYGLSFYGGEPLLNIELIDRVLNYVEQKCKGLFFTVLTTNGVLLNEENVRILEKHSVHLAVSIDGPQEEHDRRRVDHGEKGSHSRIFENLSRIKQNHPEFWRKNIVSVSVYDPASDVIRNSLYFDENKEVIPPNIFANMVNPRNTNYYERFKNEDYDLLAKRMHSLRDKYKKMVISGEEPGSYLAAVAGFPIMSILFRTRVKDSKLPFLPYTQCCIPGNRITISPNGRIDMCERVNGTYPIGDLEKGGIDYEQVAQLLQQFQQKVLKKCSQCPITRLCSLCFAGVEIEGGVEEPDRRYCDGMLNAIRNNLVDYVSVMEANGNVEIGFRNTLRLLQERVFFQS